MHVSLSRVIVAVLVTGAVRLATLYLRRLDAKEAGSDPSERRAIAASRRRARGHLWLLGAVLAGIVAFCLLFGVDRPPLNARTLLLVSGLAAAAAYCVHRMASAYEK